MTWCGKGIDKKCSNSKKFAHNLTKIHHSTGNTKKNKKEKKTRKPNWRIKTFWVGKSFPFFMKCDLEIITILRITSKNAINSIQTASICKGLLRNSSFFFFLSISLSTSAIRYVQFAARMIWWGPNVFLTRKSKQEIVYVLPYNQASIKFLII